jgi:two-component system chemotaxis sensor kinase CheA
MPDEMDEIIHDFIVETDEILESLDEKFVELEKDRTDQQLLNEIFRNVHTLKGAAGFLGFNQMVELTHATENILKKLKEGQIPVTPEITDLILESVDYMKRLLEHIREKDGQEEDLTDILARLKEIDEQESESASASGHEDTGTKKIGTILEEDGKVTSEDVEVALKVQEVARDSIEAESPPRIGEILTATGKVSEDDMKDALRKQGKSAEPEHKPQKEQTIRVDVERLDDVLNLVGELVLGRNRLLKISSNLETRYPDDPEITALNETMAFLNLITTDLQIAVMRTRMQQVKKVFNKFPRMVRDLARSRNKDVELLITGEETEVDKSVIENIADPLVHIIRNAIDHGIETREERKEQGKPETGSIRLSASQEGNNILIEVEDDGRGIDHELIKRKGVEKGLISPAQAEVLSKEEALELLFMPGFSTATEVTDISGRGVGMDVVKTNIGKLKGSIEIKTERGKGTRFLIRLPLTLAIIQTLMVEVNSEVYAIPLSSVVETVRFPEEEIRTVNHQEVIQLRGEVLPLVRLGDLFGCGGRNGSSTSYIVVVDEGKKKFGIIVDRLRGQEEVVIKAIEGDLISTEHIELIAGATITGEGRVVLIIDIAMVMDTLAKGELLNA